MQETPRTRAVLAIACTALMIVFLLLERPWGAAIAGGGLLGALLRELQHRRRSAA